MLLVTASNELHMVQTVSVTKSVRKAGARSAGSAGAVVKINAKKRNV